MEPTQPTRRTVTTIVHDLNPKLQNYLDALLRLLPIYAKQVHESSTHTPLVVKTRAYSQMGIFYHLLIRKEIYNLMGEEAIDRRSCGWLKKLLDYYNLPRNTYDLSSDSESDNDDDDKKKCVPSDAASESRANEKNECSVDGDDESEDDVEKKKYSIDLEEVHRIAKSHQKFKDPENKTLDITEDIHNLVSFRCLFHGDTVQPFDRDLLNMDNIKTVLKHVASFDRSNILLNPVASCEYFSGEANYVLDDVLLQINTSMRPFQVKRIDCRRHMYQLLLYALGLFLREGKEIRKFKVYNPLLGFQYSYEIPELDFNEFQKLVEQAKPL